MTQVGIYQALPVHAAHDGGYDYVHDGDSDYVHDGNWGLLTMEIEVCSRWFWCFS